MTPASSRTSREIRLASRPAGRPDASNFVVVEKALDEPRPGEVLVENEFMSVDPYMRGRMTDRPSYVPPFVIGQPLDGAAVGRVLLSRSDSFAAGDIVTHGFGWRERVVGLDACGKLSFGVEQFLRFGQPGILLALGAGGGFGDGGGFLGGLALTGLH